MAGKKNPSRQPDELALSLWRSASRWRKSMRAALRPLGLSVPQYLVLRSLVRRSAKLDSAPSQRELGQDTQLDKMSTSQAVRALEARGLVDRDVDGLDCRAWRVLATDSGKALLARAAPKARAASKRFFAPLGSSLPTLGEQLARLER